MAIPKITEEQMDQSGVCAAPNILNGSPSENKAIFDRMVRQVVAPAYNACAEAANAMEAKQPEWEAAEAGRVAAENGRVEAESGRVLAETGRAEAESSRVDAETVRAEAETDRAQAESDRNLSEGGRGQAESGRVLAETARAAAERQRAEAEPLRASAEEQRTTAEQSRVAAEELRVSAEQKRKQQEADRMTAETLRIEAEQARADETAGIVAAATAQAINAAGSAAGASAKAGEAAGSAQTASAAANTATGAAGAAEASAAAAKRSEEKAAEIVGGDYATNTALNNHKNNRENPHGVTAQQAGAIPTAEKGTANGVASLGEDGKVPAGQLPEMDYIPKTEKGQASGVASLGSDGKVPAGQLPNMEVDAFTKNETLTAETAKGFGLEPSAVPNDLFNALSNSAVFKKGSPKPIREEISISTLPVGTPIQTGEYSGWELRVMLPPSENYPEANTMVLGLRESNNEDPERPTKWGGISPDWKQEYIGSNIDQYAKKIEKLFPPNIALKEVDVVCETYEQGGSWSQKKFKLKIHLPSTYEVAGTIQAAGKKKVYFSFMNVYWTGSRYKPSRTQSGSVGRHYEYYVNADQAKTQSYDNNNIGTLAYAVPIDPDRSTVFKDPRNGLYYLNQAYSEFVNDFTLPKGEVIASALSVRYGTFKGTVSGGGSGVGSNKLKFDKPPVLVILSDYGGGRDHKWIWFAGMTQNQAVFNGSVMLYITTEGGEFMWTYNGSHDAAFNHYPGTYRYFAVL